MKPKIVLVITDRESNAQLKKLGVDFLELRVDLFKNLDVDYALRQFQNRRKLAVPLILTLRNQKKEGASKDFSDDKKWELLQALLPLTDWLDIEFSSPLRDRAVKLARQHKKKVLISAHDFNRLPNLDKIFERALGKHPDMVKIAAKINVPADLVRLANFTHDHCKDPLVTMGMGQWGALSRLVLPAMGSPWIYTFLNTAKAPGQIDVQTLKRHLDFYYPS